MGEVRLGDPRVLPIRLCPFDRRVCREFHVREQCGASVHDATVLRLPGQQSAVAVPHRLQVARGQWHGQWNDTAGHADVPLLGATRRELSMKLALNCFSSNSRLQNNSVPCSCVDCEGACPKPPDDPPKPAPLVILGLDAYAFTMLVIFLIGSGLYLMGVCLFSSKAGKLRSVWVCYTSFRWDGKLEWNELVLGFRSRFWNGMEWIGLDWRSFEVLIEKVLLSMFFFYFLAVCCSLTRVWLLVIGLRRFIHLLSLKLRTGGRVVAWWTGVNWRRLMSCLKIESSIRWKGGLFIYRLM